jgi:hypothetical protein
MQSFRNYFYQTFLESVDIDIQYFDAVKNRDEQTLRKLVNQKAVENGYNIGPVYHGTRGHFNKFDIKSNRRDEGDYGKGFYFTNNKNAANIYGDTANHVNGKHRLLTVVLKMANPLVGEWQDIIRIKNKQYPIRGEELAKHIKYMHFDGVIITDTTFPKTKEYVIFDNMNIKLYDNITEDDNGEIIPLSKRFDCSTDDIRF